MIQWTPQKLKKMKYICMRNWKNYGSYVSWNLKSSCETQENCSIEYPLRKELSKIISYHQQRHLKLFGWQKRIHLNVDDNFSYTRRNFLKKISTLIDPLGMLTPFTIKSKLLIDKARSAGIDCDDKVPDPIEQHMKKWFQQLKILGHIKVDKSVWENEKHIETNISIHAYSDASEVAYGSTFHLAVQYQHGDASSKLVVAKTKLAPLAIVSILRLEFMVAVLGLHLTKTVPGVYKIDQMNVNYRADNMNVLCWVKDHQKV